MDNNNQQNVPSLLDSEARGGDTAEAGFSFQNNLIVARIPEWLNSEAFACMIRESIGDAEANFFNPDTGDESRELIEYKNHNIAPAEFWEEITHLFDLSNGTKKAYHKFVLSCPSISDSLKPIINSLRRIRDAYPFYDKADPIQKASYKDYEATVKKVGQSSEIAAFMFSKVWVEFEDVNSERIHRELFRESLYAYFPEFENLPGKILNEIYANLSNLIKARKNMPVQRHEIENIIWAKSDHTISKPAQIQIHTLSDQNYASVNDKSICFDWTKFSGRDKQQFPLSTDWNNKLFSNLIKLKDWINKYNRPKDIHLTGQRRLSAGLAIGSVFSSVTGFSINMTTKDGIWSSKDYPDKETPDYSWKTNIIKENTTDELVVGIGIMKDVSKEVNKFTESTELKSIPHLYLFGEEPLISAKHANQAVNNAKLIILRELTSFDTKKIHLFLAAPAQFALFLGHRLNSLCQVQCYERISVNSYGPTVIIK